MKTENILEKIKSVGFEDMDEFVKAYLDYLPKGKRKIFRSLKNIRNILDQN